MKANCLFFKKQNEENRCKICNDGNEDLKHFILHCNKLEEIRKTHILLQRPYPEDEDELLSKIIFENTDKEEIKIIMGKMWSRRLSLIKDTKE